MSYISRAERARGLSFRESFDKEVPSYGGRAYSNAHIKNGRGIFGSGDYVAYGAGLDYELEDQDFSFIFKIHVDAAASADKWIQGKRSAGHYYGFYYDLSVEWIRFNYNGAGGTGTISMPDFPKGEDVWVGLTVDRDGDYKWFMNGVKVKTAAMLAMGNLVSGTNSPFYLGRSSSSYYQGDIEEFMFFKGVCLTEQEVIDYHTGKIGSYMNQAVLDLPMTYDVHDPTGVKTLDRSGRGHHAVFGDGSTPGTYPTKIDKGYSFDGGDYLAVPDHNDLSFGDGSTDQPFSVVALINMDDATEFPIICKGIYNGGTCEYRLVTQTDLIRWQIYDESEVSCYIGRRYNTSLTGYEGTWIVVIGTYDASGVSVGLKIYLNGDQVDDVTSEGNPGNYVAMENLGHAVEIGRNAAVYANGKGRRAMIFPFELTPLQAADISNRLLSEVNAV